MRTDSDIIRLKTPLTEKEIEGLSAGDEVMLEGIIYTARDQAHLRLCRMLENGEKLPLDLKGQVIYYCGPAPPGDRVIGSCGPTTSGRMDALTCPLLEKGLKGMIGKGRRRDEVREAIRRFSAVYFLAPGGAGAYLSARVKECKVVAFEDLGSEAIYRLNVEAFPLIVGIDPVGNDIYDRIR